LPVSAQVISGLLFGEVSATRSQFSCFVAVPGAAALASKHFRPRGAAKVDAAMLKWRIRGIRRLPKPSHGEQMSRSEVQRASDPADEK
jgi:hypothetical protein